MKTKPIPILFALLASFIACVLSIVQGVEFSVFFRRFCATALIFLFLGTILKMVIDHGFKPDEEESGEEGDDSGEGEEESESSDEESPEQSDEDDDEYDQL